VGTGGRVCGARFDGHGEDSAGSRQGRIRLPG
jgi:hypothetical protein